MVCGKVKGGKVTDEYLNEVLIYDKGMVNEMDKGLILPDDIRHFWGRASASLHFHNPDHIMQEQTVTLLLQYFLIPVYQSA